MSRVTSSEGPTRTTNGFKKMPTQCFVGDQKLKPNGMGLILLHSAINSCDLVSISNLCSFLYLQIKELIFFLLMVVFKVGRFL